MAPYSLRELVVYFLKLGTWGFGGPVALIGYMHRDLVETKKWIPEEDYKDGLALSQLAPGPLAAQLAIYLGHVHHRLAGATLAGLAFVLPSFLMVIALGYAYVRFDGLPWMQAVFYGVGPAVIGIIAISSYRLTIKNVGSDKFLWVIFTVVAAATFITEQEIIWLILAGGFTVWAMKFLPPFLSISLVTLIPLFHLKSAQGQSVLLEIAWFFIKAGAFVFGSGLAIVPFLYGGVVKEYQWLTEQQFVDAVAVAMITPGPVVITVGFIGYLVAGTSGACVAAAATFIPCYLFTVLPAPYFKKYRNQPGIKAFVDGVTAAAIGAIAGAVLVLGKRNLTDFPTIVIALSAASVLITTRRIPEPLIIGVAAVAGITIKLWI